MGKVEKERQDLEKTLGSKCAAVERLKAENTDLATALNTDQHKSLRYFEQEVQSLGERNKALQT